MVQETLHVPAPAEEEIPHFSENTCLRGFVAAATQEGADMKAMYGSPGKNTWERDLHITSIVIEVVLGIGDETLLKDYEKSVGKQMVEEITRKTLIRIHENCSPEIQKQFPVEGITNLGNFKYTSTPLNIEECRQPATDLLQQDIEQGLDLVREKIILLDIPEEERSVVTTYLFWIIDPENQNVDSVECTKNKIEADPALDVAVEYIGSRIALESQRFANIFRGKPLVFPIRDGIARAIHSLYLEGFDTKSIARESGETVLNVSRVIAKLKRQGILKPRTAQYGFATVDRKDLEIAVDWQAGMSRGDIVTKHGLSHAQLPSIANKLIELGIVKRKKVIITKSQRDILDREVIRLRRKGRSRAKTAEFLNTTERVISNSVRRSIKKGQIEKIEKKHTEDDLILYTVVISHLRFLGATWKAIEDELGTDS